MKDSPERQALLDVQEFFSLPSAALVEKDWHVVQALAAIHDAASDGLRLAFGGGTALGRAYGLLQRMSEDIDLRVISENKPTRPALKRLRRQVSERLREIGFTVDDEHIKVQHSDTYVRYDLPYAPIMRGEGVLRPEIKIEISAFPTRRPLIDRAVTSFMADANKAEAEIPKIACVSLEEIAAEKFVALTRRAGVAFAGIEELDRTLPRHVYDLSRLAGHYEYDDAARLALETMKDDAATRGDDFPAYQADPLKETLRAVETMASQRDFRAHYANLMDDMVYGDKPAFDDAMAVVRGLADRVAAG